MKKYRIEACAGKAIDAAKNQIITVIDLEGGQVVDFFAEALQNPREYLSTGVTVDCNGSLRLRPGDLIYSNLYRPMFRLISDDVGDMTCCIPAAVRRCMIFSTKTERATQTVWTT